MSPTPNLQDLVRTVRDEVADNDPLGQLTRAAELSKSLSSLGDQLLDHFVFQCRQAGMSWSELSAVLGVSKQAAHKRFIDSTPRFERFTDRARTVVQECVNQARELGHSTVGTEHILLAIFEPAESLAAIALNQLNVNRDAVRELLLRRNPRRAEQPPGKIPFNDQAKELLRDTLSEALALGHNYIGTEHMLLALISEPEYTSAAILTELGQTEEAVRSTLLENLQRIIEERARLRGQTE